MRNLTEELREAKDWCSLISSKDFNLIKEYLSNRIDTYNRDLNNLEKEPSLDNSIKCSHIISKRNELQRLLNKFDYMPKRMRELEKLISKGETKNEQ